MKQVRNFISVLPSGYGHKKISLETMDGEKLTATTSNMRLTDAYNSDDDAQRDAAKADLIDYVMAQNGIDDYEIV